MHILKLTQIGNSMGAISPNELLADIHLEKTTSSMSPTRPTVCESPPTTLNLRSKYELDQACTMRARWTLQTRALTARKAAR